jgi:hypothetical protein
VDDSLRRETVELPLHVIEEVSRILFFLHCLEALNFCSDAAFPRLVSLSSLLILPHSLLGRLVCRHG